MEVTKNGAKPRKLFTSTNETNTNLFKNLKTINTKIWVWSILVTINSGKDCSAILSDKAKRNEDITLVEGNDTIKKNKVATVFLIL